MVSLEDYVTADGGNPHATDLKLLYDFALDCKACQAKLAASERDLTDEKTKTDALTKEREAPVRAVNKRGKCPAPQ
jgi:hypothetical protein